MPLDLAIQFTIVFFATMSGALALSISGGVRLYRLWKHPIMVFVAGCAGITLTIGAPVALLAVVMGVV